eukprot:g2242.t1
MNPSPRSDFEFFDGDFLSAEELESEEEDEDEGRIMRRRSSRGKMRRRTLKGDSIKKAKNLSVERNNRVDSLDHSRMLFNTMDVNNDGTVTVEEFHKFRMENLKSDQQHLVLEDDMKEEEEEVIEEIVNPPSSSMATADEWISKAAHLPADHFKDFSTDFMNELFPNEGGEEDNSGDGENEKTEKPKLIKNLAKLKTTSSFTSVAAPRTPAPPSVRQEKSKEEKNQNRTPPPIPPRSPFMNKKNLRSQKKQEEEGLQKEATELLSRLQRCRGESVIVQCVQRYAAAFEASNHFQRSPTKVENINSEVACRFVCLNDNEARDIFARVGIFRLLAKVMSTRGYRTCGYALERVFNSCARAQRNSIFSGGSKDVEKSSSSAPVSSSNNDSILKKNNNDTKRPEKSAEVQELDVDSDDNLIKINAGEDEVAAAARALYRRNSGVVANADDQEFSMKDCFDERQGVFGTDGVDPKYLVTDQDIHFQFHIEDVEKHHPLRKYSTFDQETGGSFEQEGALLRGARLSEEEGGGGGGDKEDVPINNSSTDSDIMPVLHEKMDEEISSNEVKNRNAKSEQRRKGRKKLRRRFACHTKHLRSNRTDDQTKIDSSEKNQRSASGRGSGSSSSSSGWSMRHSALGRFVGVDRPGKWTREEGESWGRDTRLKYIRTHCENRNIRELPRLRKVQTIKAHRGAVWCMSFNHSSHFLATGGEDGYVLVWQIEPYRPRVTTMEASNSSRSTAAVATVDGSEDEPCEERHRDEYEKGEVRSHFSSRIGKEKNNKSNKESSGGHHRRTNSSSSTGSRGSRGSTKRSNFDDFDEEQEREEQLHREKIDAVINGKPYRIFCGHSKHVIDLAWSKGNFLLSASMDKTVRLWHITRRECLSKFLHSNVVTSVAFHPKKEGYCLTGCFDKKLRVWFIPDGRVVKWASTPCPITAATYNRKGDIVVAGLYDGQCFFYLEKRMRYYTQIECRNRSGANRKGKKITGLEFTPNGNELLVTTNDSRLRCIRMDDFSMKWKYKGLKNKERGLIAASMDETGEVIICGSQTTQVFIWRLQNEANYSRYTLWHRQSKGKNNSFECFSAFTAEDEEKMSQIPYPADEERAYQIRRKQKLQSANASSSLKGERRENESRVKRKPILSKDTIKEFNKTENKDLKTNQEENEDSDADAAAANVAATVALFMPSAAVRRVRPMSNPSNLELSFLKKKWDQLESQLPESVKNSLQGKAGKEGQNSSAVRRQIIVVCSSSGLINCFEHVGPPMINTH